MRCRAQPDLVRTEIDEPVELIGGPVLERDADGHASPAARLVPLWVWKLRKHPSQPLAPLRVDHLEIWIGFLDALLQLDAQRIGLVDQQIDGQAHRDVRPHGRIERDNRALRRLEQAGAALYHAVDHRLAILALADLEVARVRRGLDEITLAVDLEQSVRLAANLAADDEVGMRIDIVLLQVGAVASLDFPQR